MSIAAKSELLFEVWGRAIIRLRWLVIAGVLGLTLALTAQLPDLRMDNTTQGFLHPDDPTLLAYNDFRERFGRDELVMIAIQPPRVFDLEFLALLRSFHRDLEERVPHLDEVVSLINARFTYGSEDELIVEDLLERWPSGPVALAALKKRVLANPLYRNLLISEDGKTTTVLVRPNAYRASDAPADELGGFDEPAGEASSTELEFLGDEENDAIVEAIDAVIERYASDRIPMYVAGGPYITERLNRGMQGDISTFLVVSTLAIAGFLGLLFRRASGVILPIVVVVLSLLSTLGVMVLLGKPLSIITQILPPFLMTVGVCDSVHILVIVYRRLELGDSRDDSIVFALGHSGLAVLMTSLTTAGGLLSFAGAEISHISNLGILAPIGIMLALLYSVTLLPALLAVVPLRKRGGTPEHPWLDRLLAFFANTSTQYPWRVIGVTAAILLVAAVGASKLRFSHDPMKWFPEEDSLRIDTEFIDVAMRGSMVLEVLVDTHRENGLHEPEILARLERLTEEAKTVQRGDLFVGKSISIVEIVKEIHQALNENREEYYVLPKERQLIAQELLLFENSGADDLEDVTNPEFSVARVTLKSPQGDAMEYPELLDALHARFQEIMGDAVEIRLTGLMALLGRTFEAVVHSMGRSYVLALLIITPMMILLLGSLSRGLISMIPNLAPILLILGVMGWLEIPLDGSNLLVGSIVLGLAVDDTIHFMHRFRIYYEAEGMVKAAVHQTLQTTGAALLFTSLVLSVGFYIFMLGYMVAMVNFGLLAGLAATTAFLADVLLAPALLTVFIRADPPPPTQTPAIPQALR